MRVGHEGNKRADRLTDESENSLRRFGPYPPHSSGILIYFAPVFWLLQRASKKQPSRLFIINSYNLGDLGSPKIR